MHYQIEDALTSRRLELILFPTEKCNFRCKYCYEDFVLGQMSPDTVEGIKALLHRRVNDLDYLDIGWFGGEPLLAKSVIADIGGFTKKLCEERPLLRFRSHMTTNGFYLDRQQVYRLVNDGITEFQISLDGYGNLHDQSRPRANGSGTFDTIWNNLLTIRDLAELPVKVILRVHFTPLTWQLLEQLIEAINQEFSEDSRFMVLFKAVARYGGPSDNEMQVFTPEEGQFIGNELETLLRNPRSRSHIDTEMKICYAAKANSFAIRADGSIAKCTVALNDPRNTVGHLMRDGTLRIDNERIRPWITPLLTGDLEDLQCPATFVVSDRQPVLKLVTIKPL